MTWAFKHRNFVRKCHDALLPQPRSGGQGKTTA
jgi:hypothetical protein